jgi:Viral BACON domain
VDPNNSSTIYACFGGYSAGNVYKTVDGGATWSNVGSDLPNAPANSLVVAPFNSNFIYVGMNVGVFASTDGGATWSSGNLGAANVAVDELFWMGNTLVAATHGRGLFNVSVNPDALQITPPGGFAAAGYLGGPFSNTNEIFVLTNIGSSPLDWSLANTSAWLQVSAAGGTLTPGGASVSVSVSLAAAASDLAVGSYADTVGFTNTSDGYVQTRQFTLLVQALPDPLAISPAAGLVFSGSYGAISGASQSFYLTNNGATALDWSLLNTSVWLNVSASGGALSGGGGKFTVAVTVNSAADSLPLGSYTNMVWFTNLSDSVVQALPVVLTVQPIVLNGGFETGDFSHWTSSGNFNYCFVTGSSSYVHSGTYGAELGPAGTLGYLSQTLSTTPGGVYSLSFWVINPLAGTPNEFVASWNGSNVVDLVNLGATGWVNYQYFVQASSASTMIQFGFRNDPYYLGLDDVSVTSVPPPVLQSVNVAGDDINFSWLTQSGLVYQVQSSTNLVTGDWINLGDLITASGNSLTVTDTNAIITVPQRFYRLQMSP